MAYLSKNTSRSRAADPVTTELPHKVVVTEAPNTDKFGNFLARHSEGVKDGAKLLGAVAVTAVLVAHLAHGSSKAEIVKAKTNPKPSNAEKVTNLKQRLAKIGIGVQGVKAYDNANGVDLVKEINTENNRPLTDPATHTVLSANSIHLTPYALQVLAQVPAGEGSGQPSLIGPDGIQEFDIQYAAPGNGGVTDTVDVPVVHTQQQADALNQPLPPLN